MQLSQLFIGAQRRCFGSSWETKTILLFQELRPHCRQAKFILMAQDVSILIQMYAQYMLKLECASWGHLTHESRIVDILSILGIRMWKLGAPMLKHEWISSHTQKKHEWISIYRVSHSRGNSRLIDNFKHMSWPLFLFGW